MFAPPPRLCRLLSRLALWCGLAVACGDTIEPAARGPIGDGDYVRAVTPEAPVSTWLSLRVIDAQSGVLLPAKMSLWRDGQPLHLARAVDPPECRGTGPSLFEMGVAPGALASWNGIALWRGEATLPVGKTWIHRATFCNTRPARVSIEPGDYLVRISRGPEFEMAERLVELREGMGMVVLEVPLARAIDTRGYLAADLHIHTAEGSGDSSVRAHDRVKTEVAVGIEVLVSSDHDHHTDLARPLTELYAGLPAPAVAVVGNEVTTRAGHFNLMPQTFVPAAPAGGALAPATLPPHPRDFLPRFRALPERPIVQVNHPRLGYAAYLDSPACGPGGWTDTGKPPACPLDFDSIEVMSGALACATRIRQQIDDWYALLRFGHVSTAVGSSDTHHDSGILAGFPRSWLRMNRDDLGSFSAADFTATLRARAVVASTGPFARLFVDGQREGAFIARPRLPLRVSGELQFPSWMRVDELRLLVDGRKVKSWSIPAGETSLGFSDEPVNVSADAFVTLEAEGRTPMPSWLVGDHVATERLSDGRPACPNHDGRLGVVPFVVTNPIFVDGDADGLWQQQRL